MVDRMTAVFPTNLRSLYDNPFWLDTPFGRAISLSTGDILMERDFLEEEKNRLEDVIHDAISRIEDGDTDAAKRALEEALIYKPIRDVEGK